MACFILLKLKELPRGKTIRLFLNIASCDMRNGYSCALYEGGRLKYLVPDLAQAEAESTFDDLDFIASEPSSWRAVLSRLTHRYERPGNWFNSPAGWAAEEYGLGTWEWISFLVADRQRLEERKAA
jgi:hypothetical protein